MWDNASVLISLAGIAINLIVLIVGGVWKLSRLELALRQAIDHANRDIDDKIERQVRYFGETVSAVRQKITDVEIYTRDTFVRKAEIQNEISNFSDRVEARLDRIENKLGS